MIAAIDHLVVTAPSLDAGAEYIRTELGVEMQSGGAHPLMGTHNLLARLDESTYLEVLAIDPAAPRPDRPRWFDLDRMDTSARPSLVGWVARVKDIHAATRSAPVSPGDVRQLSRGALRWLITIPPDGRVLALGVVPMFIQWLDGPHPAAQLPESGCRLGALRGTQTAPGSVMPKTAFDSRWSLAGPPAGESPGLTAVFQTANGYRTLRTRPRR